MLACGSRSIASTAIPAQGKILCEMRADCGLSAPPFEVRNRENLQMLGGVAVWADTRASNAREGVEAHGPAREYRAAGRRGRARPLAPPPPKIDCRRYPSEATDQPGSRSAREGSEPLCRGRRRRPAPERIELRGKHPLRFQRRVPSSDAGACEAGPEVSSGRLGRH